MKSYENDNKSTSYGYFYIAFISIAALGVTFALTEINFSFFIKAVIFAAIVAVYLSAFLLLYRFQKKQNFSGEQIKIGDNPFNSEIEEKLQILEQASEFFAATLKPADMFRLISGRIGEIVPFENCLLFLTNEQQTHFRVDQIAGSNATLFKNLNILVSEGLAGRTFAAKKPQIDKNLSEDAKVFSPETLCELRSAIAVPLVKNGESFGVLQLFGTSAKSFDQNSLVLLDAIGTRIVPLLIGSQSFEKNLSSALTDSLTNLPNERAFYLVLENQIAEAARLHEKRNLAVLVMDIKNFDEINKTYGHAAGDKILSFTAQNIKNQLRQMDFLARSINDEFYAVLPTADKEVIEKIIRRIEKTFILDQFEVADTDKINVGLNFGYASFNTDGETANQLLNIALIKKRQSKSFENQKILWFPKEFVN